MINTQLEFYTINFRYKNKEKSKENHLTFFEVNVNILDFFQEYIDHLDQQVQAIESVKKTLSLDKGKFKIRKKDEIISGIIQSGEYDSTGVLSNIKNHKKRVDILRTDTILKPFYYAFYLPPDQKTGLFILQRTGVHSIHTAMKQNLFEFFGKKGFSIDMSPFFPSDVLKIINEGIIQEVTLTKYDVPKDVADWLGVETKEFKLQIIISSKETLGKKINSVITKRINNPGNGIYQNKVFGKIEFNGSEDITVKASHNGNDRKYDINTLTPFRPYEIINDKVIMGPDGHPTFESIDIAGRQFVKDFKPKIKLL